MEPSIYRLRLCDILTICVLSLLALGVVMVQSASMSVSGEAHWHWTDRGARHLLYSGIAAATFFLVGHIDYALLARGRRWKSPVLWTLGISLFTCLIVLVPHVGREVNGARRWLPLGFTQVQPSELGKWGTLFFLAWTLAYRSERLEKFVKGFLPTLAPVAAVALLIVIQDFGTAALIVVCSITLLLTGRTKLLHLGAVFPPALAAAYWFVRHKEYRWRRMTAFLDPFAAPQREGYHMIQSLLSFATGGIFGRGLGNGIQKLGYLPEDTTDFIFAVICEELGLFGALLTIALYLGIIYVAWQIARQKRDAFGRLLAFGIASMIGLQALINIAVATVSVPTKGLSLPLVSAGGSGLVITCAALGLLYSVAHHRHSDKAEEAAAATERWSIHSRDLAGAL